MIVVLGNPDEMLTRLDAALGAGVREDVDHLFVDISRQRFQILAPEITTLRARDADDGRASHRQRAPDVLTLGAPEQDCGMSVVVGHRGTAGWIVLQAQQFAKCDENALTDDAGTHITRNMDWTRVRHFPAREPQAPQLEPVAVLFRVRGASQRPLRCALYRIETGLELRLECEDREDLLRSQLFPVRDDDAIATMADQWHAALIAKGFVDLEIV